ncbi:hypothetical protein Hanom_Chr01g00045581 [Helianthus anomalus]
MEIRKTENKDWLSEWTSDQMTVRSDDRPIGWPFDWIAIRSSPLTALSFLTL